MCTNLMSVDGANMLDNTMHVVPSRRFLQLLNTLENLPTNECMDVVIKITRLQRIKDVSMSCDVNM